MNVSPVCVVCPTGHKEKDRERVKENGTERGLSCLAVLVQWVDVWGHTVIPAPIEVKSISYDSLSNSVLDWLADWKMHKWLNNLIAAQMVDWLFDWLPSCTDIPLSLFFCWCSLWLTSCVLSWLTSQPTRQPPSDPVCQSVWWSVSCLNKQENSQLNSQRKTTDSDLPQSQTSRNIDSQQIKEERW